MVHFIESVQPRQNLTVSAPFYSPPTRLVLTGNWLVTWPATWFQGNMRPALILAIGLLALSATCFAEDVKKGDPKAAARLVELIQKKQYDGFLKELSSDATDTNQPTSNGKLPIIEAVKTKDIKFVDALIQFGVLVNSKEPGTGVTPVMLAFQANLQDIARLLLSYGADPTIPDKNGKKAKDFTPSPGIKELLASWEAKGSQAFEDAPGTWIKAKNDKEESYWYNTKTTEARWNMPPSCGWQRVEYLGQPSKYVNYVTGQSIHRVPPALSWRKVKADNKELWYNWANNHTQYEQPDEMPEYLIEEANKHVNVRWFNERTNEFTWEDPKYHTPWRAINDDDGKVYYYNVQTGESTWEAPEELSWVKEQSEVYPGQFYWFNKKTGESTWETPHTEAWEKHNHELNIAEKKS
mmetsp:Transcript_14099/g.30569  ORF Transcript_14099/g.30569 Transcript_14099/m.30569 type:complete len:409 (+) Transcript_14099:6-1232(+)